MEDAVILANCLYDIGTTSPEDIKTALQSYKDQRLPHVMEQYQGSKASAKFLYGQVSHPSIKVSVGGIIRILMNCFFSLG